MESVVSIFAKLAIILLGISLGMKAPISEAGFLWKRPLLLLRSLLAVDVLVPLLTLGIVLLLPLPIPARIGLLLMAVSPGAPFIPLKSVQAGARPIFVYGLQVTVSLLAVITTPMSLKWLGYAFGQDITVSVSGIGRIMFLMQLTPLLAGILIRYFAAKFSDRVEPFLSRIANLMLMALVVLILIRGFSSFLTLGLYTWLAIALMASGALLIGHFLGGPENSTRTGLALASATRHPGLAFFLAVNSFPEQKAGPVIVAYLVLSFILATPYIRRQKAQQGVVHESE